ncbi:MAG: AMMECR1 domain-containing protein [Leptospiraceae bacterium]|nr:AMMECR1 domain-containing protein [Leptospiraceae bacterium]MCP5502117.1 AMMECR1 domain-containing protein [Leptospiraceae bacterium]
MNSEERKTQLKTWLRCRMESEFYKTSCSDLPLKESPEFFGRLGIFITLRRNNRVRGCYGSFFHRHESFEANLLEYLRAALRNDPRYEPLAPSEIPKTEILLTLASMPESISNDSRLDTSLYGLILSDKNGNSLVFVPGELRGRDPFERLKRKFKAYSFQAFRAIRIN